MMVRPQMASSDLTISNLVTGETLGLTGNGTVASKNVGSNKAITVLMSR